MPITTLSCPSCGAPLAPRKGGYVTCAYCMRTLTGVPEAAWAALLLADDEEREDLGRLTCRVAEVLYEVRGLLARGAQADVLLGERVRRPTERVVLKVLRRDASGLEDARREHATLTRLAASNDPAAPLFTTLVPQPVGVGMLRSRSLAERPALVYRWHSGFQHTLADVRRAYPGGVDGRAAVWMWRRVLSLLGWSHANGLAHGSVTSEHVLVHPRDHGAILVGWSHAGPREAKAEARDLAMSAEAILDMVAVDELPEPLKQLLTRTANDGVATGAHALADEVLRAATEAYGPPAFQRFTMPGWR